MDIGLFLRWGCFVVGFVSTVLFIILFILKGLYGGDK